MPVAKLITRLPRTVLLMVLMVPALAVADNRLFEAFGVILERHLTEHDLPGGGLISAFDYDAALAQDDTAQLLREQRVRLADASPAALDSREQAIAFWLNAYNFFMIDQILTDRPNGELVSSVWDYGGRLNPFRRNIFERPLFNVGGQQYSLDDIEKGVLLGEDFRQRGWKDARVHFAVNCASVGCPPLRQAVYTAANLDTLLSDNTRRALRTERHLTVTGNTLRLSALFDWYQADFEEAAGTVRAFVLQWVDEPTALAIRQTNSIGYIDYDWALNTPGNFPEIHP